MSKEKQRLIRELPGDVLTPVSAYLQLNGRNKCFLESSNKHEDSGRFSIIGQNPSFMLEKRNQTYQKVSLLNNHVEELDSNDLTGAIAEIMPKQNVNSELPLLDGLVGYVGYDVIREREKIGSYPTDDSQIADVSFYYMDEIVIFDHLKQSVYVVVTQRENETDNALQIRLDEILQDLQQPASNYLDSYVSLGEFSSSVKKDQFIKEVKTLKQHILEGDIFQAVLSQRFEAPFEGNPFELYRKLRKKNPSPYMFYLDFPDQQILGASPECYIKKQEMEVLTNPIAGTRKRGKTPDEDQALEKELVRNEKELAEHDMLVDLGRNDLNMLCEAGSVTVTNYQKVVKYEHVMHLVSEVTGKLRNDVHELSPITACLPAGTVSGAPKIRAMQLINEAEPVKRAVYSGGIGYISSNYNFDFALAIRMMRIQDNKAFVQAGAGIVFDSEPEAEYEETVHKAKSIVGVLV
ncbi:anthranilate synthase component I [Mangrovibacillus cuniculi]|uniref:Anthranilate synthase component 1 n=1 Tax=Mangrovibacillus cuniculi TaxID=2593652 RepID=A0A7S8CAW0_9BACI|nr:anthranilate synthase component I [Mangrovibacillus cuniculi]QPC46578.1 anthranilate synthase component I [Mangrovibacillus cuniculi]